MSTRAGRDIILTGLPRSGTNLSCTLLNRVEQTIALSEPMDVAALGRTTSWQAAVDLVRDFAAVQRVSLLTRGVALSKHLEGQVRDNFFDSEPAADGLRTSRSDLGEVRFDKPLAADFHLVIKHPAVFTALLPALAESFPCYALVRNPLAVLASWESNRIAVRDGRAPAAEAILPELARRLDAIADRHDRQIALIDWYFSCFLRVLPMAQVIRYEAVIASGGAALSPVVPQAMALREPLQLRNANPLYGWEGHEGMVERLLRSDASCWQLYTRAEVEALYESARTEHGDRGER